PTRKLEYGAYARLIAPKARSNSIVVTRSTVPSARDDGSVAILRGQEGREEGRARSTKRDAKPLGNCSAKVRKGLSATDSAADDARTEPEHGHALARVVAGLSCGVVAVVGGDEQQVVLPQCGHQSWKRRVKVAQRLIEPRSVVPVPELLVEIYKVGEQQPTLGAGQPSGDGVDAVGVVARVARPYRTASEEIVHLANAAAWDAGGRQGVEQGL